MDNHRFDALVQRLALRGSRRDALKGGMAAAATGLLATTNPSTAQDASPVATPAFPADPHPSADAARTRPDYLFVQQFDGGAWTPKPGEDGTYLLALTGVAPNTTYFSDRPERDTGLAPNQPFLDGLGFSAENPPNAAIVVQDASGEEDVLVVELMSPVYDADAATLTYDAKVLRDYGGRGLAVLAREQADYEFAASFGEGSLFIDDCPDSLLDGCYIAANGDWTSNWDWLGFISSGNCWNSSTWLCEPCGSYSYVCNETYDGCQGGCRDDIQLCGSPDCGPE